MRAEPEAVTEAEQHALSVAARGRFASEREVENRRRDNEQWRERLKKVEMRAESKGVDLFRDQAVIRSRILSMERAVNLGGTLAAA